MIDEAQVGLVDQGRGLQGVVVPFAAHGVLGDAAQALQPRAVEEILLGRLLGGVTGSRCPFGGEALGELDITVDRVADQVDRLELLRAPGYAFGAAVVP